MRHTWFALCSVVLGVAFIGCGGNRSGEEGNGSGEEDEPTIALQSVYEVGVDSRDNRYSDYDFVRMEGDDTLIVDGWDGERGVAHEYYGVIYDILNELDAPRSVLTEIENASTEDAGEVIEWGNFAMTYEFSPDEGVAVVIKE